jgi:hypothetical protein
MTTSTSLHKARNLQVHRCFVASRFQSLSLAQAFEHVLPIVRRPLFRISENASMEAPCENLSTRSVLSGGASS